MCGGRSGMYKFAKGAVYVGEFLGGRPHGLGLKTIPSGRQLAGAWHVSCAVLDHGTFAPCMKEAL